MITLFDDDDDEPIRRKPPDEPDDEPPEEPPDEPDQLIRDAALLLNDVTDPLLVILATSAAEELAAPEKDLDMALEPAS